MNERNDELGKLRQEVQIGFIEVGNRFQSVNDRMSQMAKNMQVMAKNMQDTVEELKKTNETIGEIQQQLGRIAKLVDDGFGVIQNYISNKLEQQDNRISNLENRIDKAGL